MITALLFYIALLAVALAAQPWIERLRLPFSVFLVLLGFLASELLIANGGDTGLRWDHFGTLVFHVLLPALIFEAAFNIDARLLWRNLPLVLMLAIPMMVLSAGITGMLLYVGLGHASGFPWIAALLGGAMLAATDPAAVLSLFKRCGVPARLSVLTDGESLFNDATAVVLFMLLLGLARHGGEIPASAAGIEFLRVFFGGILAGASVAGIASLIRFGVRDPIGIGVLTLLSAYGGFYLAESVHVSGVMASLSSGLLLGHLERRRNDTAGRHTLHMLWEFQGWLANSLVFLLAGITFQTAMFTDQWLAMLIGIAAVLAARALGLILIVPFAGALPGIEPVPHRWLPVLHWGGIRGAVTLALALSLPTDLPYWWTLQSIAYGVVLFTLLIQATSMEALLKWLKIRE
ncbi:MAG: cation:proton antiporter [Gammaproteobacteria bacterium]|nr:cation:proton antiporter [Gammaproteobacteria bacterium]